MENYVTLSELQARLKLHLERAVPVAVWVAAEIGQISVNRSGHCYMELVEKGGAGGGGIPRARVRAVAWASTWGALHYRFLAATGAELAMGMKVLLCVSVSYHELYGLSLVVSDIDATYTLGDMQRQRQETIARLRAEGLLERNRHVPVAAVLQRVAVVSSATAAGYQDFMAELARTAYRIEVVLFDAVMQGAGAEQSLIDALGRVAGGTSEADLFTDTAPFDAVVIIRGGGATSDLAAFDSYPLAACVAQMPMPVIAGIGHDRDQSIVDMVSAMSVKTPTAAAGVILESFAVVDARVESLTTLLRERAAAALARAGEHLEVLGVQLRERFAAALTREGERLDALARLLDARRPEAILALGFAIVRRGGVAVRDAATLAAGEHLNVQLHNGDVNVIVE